MSKSIIKSDFHTVPHVNIYSRYIGETDGFTVFVQVPFIRPYGDGETCWHTFELGTYTNGQSADEVEYLYFLKMQEGRFQFSSNKDHENPRLVFVSGSFWSELDYVGDTYNCR